MGPIYQATLAGRGGNLAEGWAGELNGRGRREEERANQKNCCALPRPRLCALPEENLKQGAQ